MRKDYLSGMVVGLAILLGLSPMMADNLLLTIGDHSMPIQASAHELNRTNNNISVGASPGRELNLGSIPTGLNSTKKLSLGTGQSPVLVTLNVEGNISDQLEFDSTHHFKGEKDIPISFLARKPGNYTGTMYVKTEDPKNRLGRQWINLKQLFY